MDLITELLPYILGALAVFLLGRSTGKSDKETVRLQRQVDIERTAKIKALAEAKKEKVKREQVDNNYINLADRVNAIIRKHSSDSSVN